MSLEDQQFCFQDLSGWLGTESPSLARLAGKCRFPRRQRPSYRESGMTVANPEGLASLPCFFTLHHSRSDQISLLFHHANVCE